MDFSQIFYDFFGKRIAEQGLYGPIEYLVYAGIMLALLFFVLFPLLDKRGIKFDSKFLLALLPYILFGAGLRVLEDMAIIPSSWNPLELAYYFVTPGIYIFIAAVTVACLFISLMLSKQFKFSFHKIFAGIGLIPSLPLLIFELLAFKAWLGVLAVLILTVVTVAILFFVFKKLGWKILQNKLNVFALTSQVFDGSATFVATQFFLCGEQHPLSGWLLDIFPVSFIFAKIVLVLVIIHYVDEEIENKNLRGFIKIIVIVLGFATGGRDLLTLGVGTCL